MIILVRLQSVRKSRLFLPSPSTALPASWSADWGARAARPISSCPPTPCPHTQPPTPPPTHPPPPPPFLSWKAPVCRWPTTTSHVLTPHTTFLQTFPSLLLFSSPKRAVAPSLLNREAPLWREGEQKAISLHPLILCNWTYLCQLPNFRPNAFRMYLYIVHHLNSKEKFVD